MKTDWDGVERRHKPVQQDWLFRMTVVGNVVVWLVFLAALIYFHNARPEFVSGVQRFWGVPGREQWLASGSSTMFLLLCICCVMSLVLIFMRHKRSRRSRDTIAINLLFLVLVTGISILGILI